MRRAFTEHGLCRIFPEMTGAAAVGFFAQGLRLVPEIVMGVFQSPLRIINRRARAQCGQDAEGSFDPIGIAQEKYKRRSRLTLSAMLALY
jgi:hypothetical protein